MDILVLGAYGMLGHRLLLDLQDRNSVVGAARRKKFWKAPIMDELDQVHIHTGIDAFDFSSIESLIQKERPECVINCIGIVKQLDAARDPVTSITINSLLPHKLSAMCQKMGIRLVHFSTDCVFSGRKGNYSQNDIPDPVDLYGRSKLLGEVGGENVITIRSSLIGREMDSRNGLIEWFLSNRGGSVKGFKKAIFSGFPTTEMSNIVSSIISDNRHLSGVWQVAAEPISKYDLLCKVKSKANIDIKIVPDDMVVCDRSLDGSAFNKMSGYVPPNWDSMIDKMIEGFSAYEKENA